MVLVQLYASFGQELLGSFDGLCTRLCKYIPYSYMDPLTCVSPDEAMLHPKP